MSDDVVLKTKAEAYHDYWSSFSLPAYEENSVPDEATLPYITYTYGEDSIQFSIAQSVSVWYRDSSFHSLYDKVMDISEDIGRGGVMLPCENGAIWITRGVPFSQTMTDPSDELVKRAYINITVEFLTAD